VPEVAFEEDGFKAGFPEVGAGFEEGVV